VGVLSFVRAEDKSPLAACKHERGNANLDASLDLLPAKPIKEDEVAHVHSFGSRAMRNEWEGTLC
jgi:hypothetical protein